MGGLVGNNADGSTVTTSSASGPVTGVIAVGGLVGYNTNKSTVSQSYATGKVTGSAFTVGGLVGGNDLQSTITQSYATGAVEGGTNVGGLAGSNSDSSTVTSSYASGAVTGDTNVGGLIGSQSAGSMVSQSYARGDVTGRVSVGGLVGYQTNSTVSETYATGKMTALPSGSNVGGLIGNNDGGTVETSYWDTTTSGTNVGIAAGTTTGATGLTTAQFQNTAFFMASASTWDFNGVWAPPSAGYYPELYAVTPVVWVSKVTIGSIYGSGVADITFDTSAGGPAYYVFGPAGDSLTTGTVNVDPTTPAGTVVSTLPTQNQSENSTEGVTYRVFYYGSQDRTVNPAPLTITADSTSKLYGATPTLTGYTTSGLQNGDTVGSVTLVSAGTSATASVAGGPYAIVASNATGGTFDPANYDITYVDGALTVNPAPLTVTADSASKLYGATPTLTGFSSTGLQNGETIGSVTLLSAGTAGTASVAGGPYDIVASNATGGTFDPGNYDITYVNGLLTVNPAPLTVTADSTSKLYGATPTLTGFSSTGLQNGETIGSVTLLSAGTAGTASVAGGPYTIVASNATGGTFDPGNYDITYVNGLLTVNPAPLTVTADSTSKLYGATPTLTGFSSTGLQNGETIGSVTLLSAGTAGTASVAGGPYAIVASNATAGTFDPGNYDITYVNGLLTVDPRPITVRADDKSMVRGTSMPELTWTITEGSLVNGDELAGALATDATSSSPIGTYPILQGSLVASSNYAMTFEPGTLTVTPPFITFLPPGYVETEAPLYADVFMTGADGEDDGTGGLICTGGVAESAACVALPHVDNFHPAHFVRFSSPQ